VSFFQELKRRNVFRVAAAYTFTAWLLIQVAETIFPLFGYGDNPARIVVIALSVLFIPAVILAWVFELTPEGIKRDHEVDRSRSIAPQTGKKLDRIIMVALAFAVGYFAVDKFVLSEYRDRSIAEVARQEGRSEVLTELYGDKSIAVLPFENRSSDKEQDYFADGISEELLNLLAKIPSLRVIARTSSFSYKGKDIADLSRDLNVDHVLDGSVRKAGDKVRVSAKLIHAKDSSYLWVETYERTLDDIFLIQDDIAAAVVAQLKVKLLGAIPTSQSTDVNAYALYLQARELARQSTAEGHQRSVKLYQNALDIAPDYAAAWGGLADGYNFLDEFELARQAANKALELDPDFALAHASLGWIAMVHDHDLVGASQNLERALKLDPTNPQIIRIAASLSSNLVRLNEAIGLLEYAVARDPVQPLVHAHLALTYFSAGRLDDAIRSYRTALRLSPNGDGWSSFIGAALLSKNEPVAALAAMEQEPSEAWRLIGLAMAHHDLGHADESDANLAELIEKYAEEYTVNISYVLAYRGEADRAFEWLDRARQYNDPGLSEVAAAPEFANLVSDPRWLPFLQSIGKAPEQLAAVEFTVTRPE
jgi:TolB-like protein/Tfp pilus assembly protein PilF